ncbi:MAG TPA: TonB-dependent receptor [Steroidobacteraceae bacterium]|nr:TonB-dependent receptor [Steroidobacteraceae bacterium]
MTRSRNRKIRRVGSAIHRRSVAGGVSLASAISAILATTSALAQEQGGVLEQVVVTAQKREENLQNVPLSIQAIGTEKLEQLHITDFEDYAKFLPSVSYQTLGPGSARVFMRGVSSGDNGNHSGPLPSVGQYLDEQPITTIQGALDIHIYDIARVEVLAGPQGTLYGASSQSGTIRIITNKPDPSGFKAGYDLTYNTHDPGDPGYIGEGFVNIPVGDAAAVRLVGWYEKDGGYISNVAGTRTYPTSGITVSNADRAKNDYNDVETYGGRAALRVDLSDSWTITPTIMAQEQDTNGLFAYDPSVGDLKVTHFFPENSKDRWWQAALTVEGKISNFDLVYAGAYLKRDFFTQSDYSDYSFFYDQSTSGGSYYFGNYFFDDAGALIDPGQYIQGKDLFTKQSHELRISSPQDQRFRFVAGLFYQRQQHDIEQRYKINNLATISEVTGWPDTFWLTEQVRVDRDYAVFGEVSFDFTEKLTGTAGIRFFKAKNSLEGFFGFGLTNPFDSSTGEQSCFSTTSLNSGPCTNLDKEVDESGNTPKVNLTYRFTDQALSYVTYSEGFRPGGVNRRGTFPPYTSDYLKNYEIGWKTTWFENRLRFNGALFWEKWDDFQYSFLGENGLTNVTNAGRAEIKGIEMDLNWAVTADLLLSAGATWLDPKLKDDFCQRLVDDNDQPLSIQDCAANFPESFAPSGTELPVTPKFKANVIARYTFNVAQFDAHLQGAYVYQGESRSALMPVENNILGQQDAYGIADFTFGVEKNGLSIELFINNAFDERAPLYRYAECDSSICGAGVTQPGIIYTGTNEPRTFGITLGQRF